MNIFQTFALLICSIEFFCALIFWFSVWKFGFHGCVPITCEHETVSGWTQCLASEDQRHIHPLLWLINAALCATDEEETHPSESLSSDDRTWLSNIRVLGTITLKSSFYFDKQLQCFINVDLLTATVTLIFFRVQVLKTLVEFCFLLLVFCSCQMISDRHNNFC